MKHPPILVITLVSLSLFAVGCTGEDGSLTAFCDTHTDPALEGLDPSDPGEAKQLLGAMASMEENAPAEIKDDVTMTRKGFEAVTTGDVANIDVEDFQAAALRVEEYAEDKCS